MACEDIDWKSVEEESFYVRESDDNDEIRPYWTVRQCPVLSECSWKAWKRAKCSSLHSEDHCRWKVTVGGVVDVVVVVASFRFDRVALSPSVVYSYTKPSRNITQTLTLQHKTGLTL